MVQQLFEGEKLPPSELFFVISRKIIHFLNSVCPCLLFCFAIECLIGHLKLSFLCFSFFVYLKGLISNYMTLCPSFCSFFIIACSSCLNIVVSFNDLVESFKLNTLKELIRSDKFKGHGNLWIKMGWSAHIWWNKKFFASFSHSPQQLIRVMSENCNVRPTRSISLDKILKFSSVLLGFWPSKFYCSCCSHER